MDARVGVMEDALASILNNVSALAASRQLQLTGGGLQQTIQRLTTGLRINRASDDAAGLGISNKLGADIRIAGQGKRNANDGVSYLQVADGVLDEATSLLTRAAELAQQAQTGTISDSNRTNLDAEFQKISNTLNSILTQTKFNGATVFGAGSGSVSLSGSSSAMAGYASSAAGVAHNGYHTLSFAIGNLLSSVAAYAGDAALTALQASAFNTGAYFDVGGSFQNQSGLVLSAAQAYLTAHPTDANAASIYAMVTYLQSHAPNGGTPHSGPDAANAAATATAAAGTASITGQPSLTISVGGYSDVAVNTDASAISSALGSLTTANNAASAQVSAQRALEGISSLRSSLGASMQRLNSVSNALGIQVENVTAAYSQIRDANVADEVVSLTKFQILSQSGTSALGQANQAQQQILALLR